MTSIDTFTHLTADDSVQHSDIVARYCIIYSEKYYSGMKNDTGDQSNRWQATLAWPASNIDGRT